MSQLKLIGLPGGNQLGFLAALGVLRIATRLWPASAPRLHWEAGGNGWYPVLSLDMDLDQEAFLDALHPALATAADHVAFSLPKDGKPLVADYRAFVRPHLARATPGNRDVLDMLAGLVSDLPTVSTADSTPEVSPSQLRMVSGGGRQTYLTAVTALVAETTRGQLSAAVFSPWTYADDARGHALRLDPRDVALHSTQWKAPTKAGPAKTMWGALRLSVEALAVMPVVPLPRRAGTVGFKVVPGGGNEIAVWTWPMWTVPLRLNTVRSLLAHPGLQPEKPDRQDFAAMGVSEVYRASSYHVGMLQGFGQPRPA